MGSRANRRFCLKKNNDLHRRVGRNSRPDYCFGTEPIMIPDRAARATHGDEVRRSMEEPASGYRVGIVWFCPFAESTCPSLFL